MAKAKIEERFHTDRDAAGVRCSCGGYADKVDTTHEERMKYDCGRYQMLYRMTGEESGYACCAVAYKCAICGTRIVGSRAAPEMD